MGKRKERRLAAMSAASRRVKLDLFAEPSGDMDETSLQDGRNINEDSRAGVPSSPSSSGAKQENPLLLLGQYSDDELDVDVSKESKDTGELRSLDGPIDQAEHATGGHTECIDEIKEAVGLNDTKNADDKDAEKENIILGSDQHCGADPVLDVVAQNEGHVPSQMQTIDKVSEGWKVVWDEQTSQYYYWNSATGETSWILPQDLALQTAEIDQNASVSVNIEGSKPHEDVGSYANVSTDNQHGRSDLTTVVDVEEPSRATTHLAYSAYPVAGIPFPASSTLPYVGHFQKPDGISSENLSTAGEVPEQRHQLAPESSESSMMEDSHPVRLVEYSEKLLERLRVLQRSASDKALHDSITKEIEIRQSDCKSLSPYGSTLLPLWWHIDGRLRQLDSIISEEEISRLIPTKPPREPKAEKDSEISHDASLQLSAALDHHVTVDENKSVGEGSGKLENEHNFSADPATSLNAMDVDDMDMDVEMEVDDAAEIGQTHAEEFSVAEGRTPGELVPPPSSLEPLVIPPSGEFNYPPPHPDDEWIPPPPPPADYEPVPPPPPPPEEPPISSLPSTDMAVSHLYQEQYHLGCGIPSFDYYPTVNGVTNNTFYVNAVGNHAAEPIPPPYFDPVVASVLPEVGTDVQPVVPVVYYDPSAGNFPVGLAVSNVESNVIVAPSVSSVVSASMSTAVQENVFVAIVEAAETSSVNGNIVNAPASAVSKIQPKVGRSKKRTIVVAPTLRSNKKVSSLVDKWKAVKEELHEEEYDEPENEYEFFERKKQKEIEEWHAQQIATREAQDNANFVPLGGDWRERVRRKKAQAKAEVDDMPPEKAKVANRHPDMNELSKGLPSSWQAYWDEATKEVYYANAITSATTWTRPTK